MSKTNNLTDFLTAEANAIRSKKGYPSTHKINPQDFASEIESIETTPVLQQKTVTPTTSNQTVTPDSGYDGLSEVTVDATPLTFAKIVTPSTSSQTITADDPDIGLHQVIVNPISPTKAAQTYIPTTTDQTIPSGRWLAGDQTIKGDANLTGANIKSGVSLFGVAGTFTGGGSPYGAYKIAYGSLQDKMRIVWDSNPSAEIEVYYFDDLESSTMSTLADGDEVTIRTGGQNAMIFNIWLDTSTIRNGFWWLRFEKPVGQSYPTILELSSSLGDSALFDNPNYHNYLQVVFVGGDVYVYLA